MKLFLSSVAILAGQVPDLLRIVGKERPEDVAFALIENAADTHKEDEKQWMYDSRNQIMAQRFAVDLVDLRQYRHDTAGLTRCLGKYDVIWLGGGNTYYLRWLLWATQADALITQLIVNSKVYGGESAGSVVAGPTLRHFEAADNPHEAPEIVYDGLGLTDIVVVPHWGSADDGSTMQAVDAELKQSGTRLLISETGKRSLSPEVPTG